MGDAYLVARAQDGYINAYELLVRRHSAVAYRVWCCGRPETTTTPRTSPKRR